jgi:thiol:disulfide interchange protein DsbD
MDKKQPYNPMTALLRLTATLLLLLSTATTALDQATDYEQDLLEPEQAFAFSATVEDDSTLQVSWKIADGYYMYRDRMRFSSETPGVELGEPSLPAGKIKEDEFFGKIATFRNQATATIPVIRKAGAATTIQLKAVSQGCADIGVCYPPHTQLAQLEMPAAPATATDDNQTLKMLNALSDNLGLDAGDDEFLDPDIAFQADIIEASPTTLIVRWIIAEGYYLYRDKLNIQISGDGVTAGPVEIPAGEIKHDEFFGDVAVFHNEIQARVPLTRANGDATDINVQLGYQGCAEAGICYPPIKKQLAVTLAAYDPGNAPATALTQVQAATTNNTDTSLSSTSQDDFARVLQDSSLWWAMLFFFAAGVLLAFTACVYPMIPILSSIIVGQGQTITTGKAFMLSLLYVEGVAVTYAVIGVISAQLGAGVQAFFQNPWILTGFALIFVALALSMFGFFSLQMPAFIQARLSNTSHRTKGGTLLGVFIMGILSALIVGPCAGPVLIGALIYTSQSGDYLTGALAMFALGNGMGAPLLVIGASGGKLLPKAGGWMNTVKAVFGVILLGVAIVMLERILPGPVTLVMWALLLIVSAIYMRALDALPDGVSGWHKLWKGLGIAMLIYGIILIIGATTGARDPLNPLRNINTAVTVSSSGEHTSQPLKFERIKSVEDFNAAVQKSAAAGKPVMLDFYADWCTYCIQMEEYTFPDQQVQKELANVTLLQADVTDNDETDIALLNHFKLFAPPAILFFGTNGEEHREYRLVGVLDAVEFLEHLQQAIPE